MKLYIVSLGGLLILQSIFARPTIDENIDDLEDIDYPDKGVFNQQKQYLDIEEEIINEYDRVRRNVGTNKNIGTLNNNRLLTAYQNNLASTYNYPNNEKQNKDVHKFIQQEKHYNTIQNNNPVKSTGGHKYYYCIMKGNVTNRAGVDNSSYDKIYYEFVKNTKANKYNLVNVTVIHGYHGNISVIPNKSQVNGNQRKNRNGGPTANHFNIYKQPQVTTVSPRNAMIPSKSLESAYRSNAELNNDSPAHVEEMITKKLVNKDECILVGNGCPHGMMRDPSGRYCLPDYSQMEDDPLPAEDYD